MNESSKAEELASKWGIGLETAKRTLQVTTQRGVRHSEHPMHRRYRTRQSHLRYPVLKTRIYSDTKFSSIPGIGGDRCAQVFVTDFKWSHFHPMKKKSEAGIALRNLVEDVGIPAELVTDYANEEMLGTWKEVVDANHIKQSVTEPYSPWQKMPRTK
jgi:hypothetical protein